MGSDSLVMEMINNFFAKNLQQENNKEVLIEHDALRGKGHITEIIIFLDEGSHHLYLQLEKTEYFFHSPFRYFIQMLRGREYDIICFKRAVDQGVLFELFSNDRRSLYMR